MIVNTAPTHTMIDTKLPVRKPTTFVVFEPARPISYVIACVMSTRTKNAIEHASAFHDRGSTAITSAAVNTTTNAGIHGNELGPGTQSSATNAVLVAPLCTNLISPTEMRWNFPGEFCTIGGRLVPM